MRIHSLTVRRTVRPLRWFLLLWECLVYVTGLLSLYGVDLVLSDQRLLCGPTSGAGCAPTLAALLQAHLGLAGGFSGLMLVHAALLWRGLSGTLPPRVYAPYFLVQAGLVWALVLLVGQASVTLSLCLALAVGATGMLTEVRAISIVATGYLLLALVSTMWTLQAWQNWNVFWIIFWFKSGDMALLLFAAGYVLLYVQQIHAQAQLAASHAHLQASAARIEDLTLLTERQRLARELHDTLSQGVAGLIMQLEAASWRSSAWR